MKTLRRELASSLVFLLAFSPLSSARAVSLYDGLKTRPAPAAPILPTAPTLPALPQSLPGLPSVIGADLAATQAPSVAADPVAAPSAPESRPILPQPLADLEASGSRLAAPAADARAALDPLFDAGIAAHVGSAISEYFGILGPGEQPGVVVAKRRARSTDGAPTDDEMHDNVKASPKTNPEREEIAIRMFEKGGAKHDPATALVTQPDFTRDGQVQVQEVKGWGGGAAHNIFVVKKGKPKPGQKERVIVITSHNDKVDVGDGVIDNWTGTTMVAHLYQSIKDLDTEATYIFAAFAREEEGLVGSKQFLRSMTPDQRAMIEGNINYDTIAIKGGDTNSWQNNSDEVLLAAADAAVADANKSRGPGEQLRLERAHLNGGDADSSTFRRQRPPIPAMTIYSGPEDLIFSIIHSVNDNIGAFDFALYKNTYLVAMALIHWLERHPLTPAPVVGHA